MLKKIVSCTTLTSLALLGLLLTPAFVFAAAAESFWDLGWYWANFLIYAALVYYFARKPLARIWHTRVKDITTSVNQGKIRLEEAARQREEARAKLATVEQEVAERAQSIKSDAQNEARHIVEEAKERAQRIVLQAEESAKAERRAREYALRQELSENIIEQAAQKLQQEIGEEADRGLRNRAAEGIQSLVQ